jgi:YbbR domain-containing protein
MPKIFENLWVKLAALILAVLLWFHVATNKVYEDTITLPIHQVIIPEKLVLTQPPPDSATVLVSAVGKRLLRSDWKRSGLKWTINKDNPGKYRIDLTPENLALTQTEKVEIIEVIEPREWGVGLDRKVEKNLPVRSRVIVKPDDGYAIKGEDSVFPGAVRAVGPASLLDKIKQMETAAESLERARNDLKIRVPIENPALYGLTVNPDSVDVFVKITPIKSRIFPDISVRLINAPRLRPLSVFPPRVELRVGGDPDKIDDLPPSKISVLADYSEIGDNDYISLKAELPPGFYLLYKSADSVKIIRE